MRDTMNDDIIREKLNQYESPVSDRNWDVIAEALKKKKRRRFFLWWQTLLPGLLLIVAGIGAYVWLRPSDESNRSAQQNAAIVNSGTHNNGTDNTIIKENNPSNTNSIGNENATNKNVTAADENNFKPIATKDLKSSDNTAINKAIINTSTNNNTKGNNLSATASNNSNNSITATKSNTKNTSINSGVSAKAGRIKSKNIATDDAKTELSNARVQNATSKRSVRSKRNAKVDTVFSDDENASNSSISNLSLFTKKKKKGKQNNASAADVISKEVNDEDALDTKNETVMNTELSMEWARLKWKGFTLAPHFPPPINYDRGRIKCPLMFTPRRNDWYLDIYASPNLTNRSLSNRNNQTALNKKDTSERSTLSFSAGINLAKNIGNSFILRTGINYSLTNEKFSYSRINSIKDIIIITVKKIPIAPGDTTYIYDTTHIQQIGTQLTKASNRYHSIDVPLIFGYETRGEDIRFNINAGVIFNITSIAKGKTLSVADSVIDISSSGYYKTNLGISLFGSVMMLKRVNDRLDLFAEPYYRQGLGNMATDKAFFKQTQSSYGLNLGIRFRFNGRQRR